MHRSRLFALLLDTPAEEAAATTAFWSAALGAPARPVSAEPQFTQAVDDAPRYHVDIETDDVEAETTRLVALGAIQVAQWLECRVLRAPGGHLLLAPSAHRRLGQAGDERGHHRRNSLPVSAHLD
jgi:hypothetical protein